jgi:farnesyl diphosphate synthase
MLTAADDKVDFTQYTIPKYKAIVKYKTAFYSFYLPVASAMFMAGVTDEVAHTNAKSILLQMGEFFQIQDDYLDCYGDPEVTGKIGTDIEDNKCSWLVVQAIQRANPDQLKSLQENYAQHDSEKIEKVKEVFTDLDIQQVYSKYEETSYIDIVSLIDNLSVNLPKEMFNAFAKKIYKRDR